MNVWIVSKHHCDIDHDTGECGDHQPIVGVAGDIDAVKRMIDTDLRKEWITYSKYWDSYEEFSKKLSDEYYIKKYDVVT